MIYTWCFSSSSLSEHKTYSGEIPDGIKGEFGSGIKSLVITLNHVANVSEPKIHEFLENIGVHISKATISRILTKDTDVFHKEKAEILKDGLKATPYQQIDDTSARVNGNNHYTQILCSPPTFRRCSLKFYNFFRYRFF